MLLACSLQVLVLLLLLDLVLLFQKLIYSLATWVALFGVQVWRSFLNYSFSLSLLLALFSLKSYYSNCRLAERCRAGQSKAEQAIRPCGQEDRAGRLSSTPLYGALWNRRNFANQRSPRLLYNHPPALSQVLLIHSLTRLLAWMQ